MDNFSNQLNSTGRYRYIEHLGRGGFGRVAKIQSTITNEIFAVKVLEKRDVGHEMMWESLDERKKRILREILHQKKLSGHPLIVEFKEVFLTDDFICIVMEYCAGGNMWTYTRYCHALQRPFTEEEARAWFQQLIIGLRFCHKHNIINRDVKLENTLRFYDPNGARPGWWAAKCKIKPNSNHQWFLKICDFGYSKDLEQNSGPKSRVGTMHYCSPEVLNNNQANGQIYDGQKCDAWSCGVVLYFLLIGKLPFDQNCAPVTQYENISNANYTYPAEFEGSEGVEQLIQQLLCPNPEERFSLDDVINHPWFQINLPKYWNENFDQVVAQKQTVLQSDEEIKQLIDRVFCEALQNNGFDNSIQQEVHENLHNHQNSN